jgi:hypothetical protein
MRTFRAPLVVGCGFAALLASEAAAQAPDRDRWVEILLPVEWRGEPPASVTSLVGGSVRIEGQAVHPDSIVSVSVNGRNAAIRRDNIGVVTFTFDLRTDVGTREVRVVARTARDSIVELFPVALDEVTQPLPPFFPTVLLPGSGQFKTGRSGLGVAVLGASLGAAAAGVLITQKEVVCATRTSSCEGSAVLDDSSSSRPYLIPGLVAAVAISAVGAWQAGKSPAAGDAVTGATRPPNRLAEVLQRAAVGVGDSRVELRLQLRRF